MSRNKGLTLYDRIMVYRKLKEGDEGEPGAPQQPGEEQGGGGGGGGGGREERGADGDNSHASPRPLQRSDSSFGSVDISDLTGPDDKNRSPTPQPTFDGRPGYKVKERRTSSAMMAESATTAAVAMAARDQSYSSERHETQTDQARASLTEPRTPETSRKPATGSEKDNFDKQAAIAALDKMADRDLNRLLGKEGGGEEDGAVDQQILDTVFSSKFQAQLDDFLRTT